MIRDILLLQKRELEERINDKYIERNIKLPEFNNSLIKVIIGPRRAGKSFLAMHILKNLENFAYANFDDEKLLEIKDYDEIINSLKTIYNNPKYFFFDEIQNLPKWELFANRLQRQGFNLILTGSNSKLLSKELSTHLTGRHLEIFVFPFSFKEYISNLGELTLAEKKEKLNNYLTFGGYPEPLINKINYKDYLKTLYDSIIYKDIIKRFNLRNPNTIEEISKQLISNIAKEFSYGNLQKLTNSKNKITIKKYVDYLEETFIFFKIQKFSYKIKEQVSSNKKIYCIDNGFIYAKSFKINPDTGRLYENIVAIELKKKELDKDIELYFWKNQQGEEVDFLIRQGLEIKELIQVCYDVKDLRTKEREIRALLKASKELKCKNLTIINYDYDAEEKTEWFGIKGTIKFIPLWKWLLEENIR